ncbi:hypothetical protein JCM11641_006485 [Rhodosporidiobolus odoratus]
MSSPLPPPLPGAAGRIRSPLISTSRDSMRDILDLTSQPFGNPNAFPGPPKGHFFPAVPRAQREKAQQVRLGSASPPPPSHSAAAAKEFCTFPPPPLGTHTFGGRTLGRDEDEQAVRDRQAKLDLASSGPFDNRRPSAVSLHPPVPSSFTAVQSTAVKSVGTGGSTGTKRRHRDTDRTSWDAASELLRLEREKETPIDGLTAEEGQERSRGDKEKTPTPSMTRCSPGAPHDMGEGITMSAIRAARTASHSLSPEIDDRRGSAAPSIMSTTSLGADEEADELMALDDESIRSGASGKSKATGASASGKEPAKKRSRTLTTPAQTAVLNALLAKTRFPSTETREEVGKEIGMSARRVQIWFQNRRQSQKRQRDRDAQDAAQIAVSGYPAGVQPVYQHPYAAHAHIDPYSSQATHFYPPAPPQAHGGSAHFALYPHPSSSRPELLHRASTESMASQTSYVSAAPSQRSAHNGQQAPPHWMHERGPIPPLPSDPRLAYSPYASAGYPPQQHPNHPLAHSHHPLQHSRPPGPLHPIPPKLYFPHIARPHPHAPPARMQTEAHASAPTSPTATGGGHDFKLPSLSSILSPTVASSPYSTASAVPPPESKVHAPVSVPVDHQPMFSHSPFSPVLATATLPSSAAVSAAPSTYVASTPRPFHAAGPKRALFSPEPSTSSFERLRISNGVQSPPLSTAGTTSFATLTSPLSPLSPSTSTSTPPTSVIPTALNPTPPEKPDSPIDILDVAIEAMAYRPSRHLPPRQTLPPLRSVFGDQAMQSRKAGSKGGKSEADKALLAPILPSFSTPGSSSFSSAQPPRLAPISTFAPLSAPSSSGISPLSPTAPSAVRTSTHSAQSHHSAGSATTHSVSTADFDFAGGVPGTGRAVETGLGRTGQGGVGGEGERGRGGSAAPSGGSAGTQGTGGTGSPRTSVSSQTGVGVKA